MKCPKCDVPLVMSDRQGIEIDYCPQCRGVWLDRGELDKIIERSNQYTQPSNNPNEMQGNPDYRHYDHKQGDYHKYKRKSWLNELFD